MCGKAMAESMDIDGFVNALILPGVSGVIFIIPVPSLDICELCSEKSPSLSTTQYAGLSLLNYI
jgi:hypothetical protein